MAQSTAVAKRKKAEATRLAAIAQMTGDAGAGMEDMTAKDYAIPFINLLQALSPQVNKSDPQFIEGASAGDFINSVTGDLYSGEDGFTVIPVRFVKQFNEWVPRDDGGGFIGSHPSESHAMAHVGEGNDIVETSVIYCLVQRPDGLFTQALLSLTSTKLKVARKWNSLARMRKLPDGQGGTFTPPYFGIAYKVTAISESNNKGAFYNLKVEEEGLTLEREDGFELYESSKEFLELLRDNLVGADFNKEQGADEDGDTDGDDDLF